MLRGVVSQRLMQRSDEPGLIPAVEILVGTLTVQRCIEEQSRTAQLSQVIAEGWDAYGMQSFNQSAIEWYQKGMVSYEEARRTATSQTDFERWRSSGSPWRRTSPPRQDRRRWCPAAGSVPHPSRFAAPRAPVRGLARTGGSLPSLSPSVRL